MSYFDKTTTNKPANDFGIVTVMDVDIYPFDKTLAAAASSDTPKTYLKAVTTDVTKRIGHIEHLQIATLSTDGPNITIQGGKYNNALIKYGKTARCEMTDALGNADTLVALGGAMVDDDGNLSITDKFGKAVTLVGDAFVVDKETGKHVPVKVLMYQFLPDSTTSFAFDTGNAATFDLNGDLLATELGSNNAASGQECPDAMGYFFSIIPMPSCELQPSGN